MSTKAKVSTCILCDCACKVTCNCEQCTCSNGPCAASSAARVAAYIKPSLPSVHAPHPLGGYTDVLIEREGLTWAVSMVDLSIIYSPVIPRPFKGTPDIYEVYLDEKKGQFWLHSASGPTPVDEHSLKVMRARYIVWEKQRMMSDPAISTEIARVMNVMSSMDGAYMSMTPDATGLTPLIIPMTAKSTDEERMEVDA